MKDPPGRPSVRQSVNTRRAKENVLGRRGTDTLSCEVYLAASACEALCYCSSKDRRGQGPTQGDVFVSEPFGFSGFFFLLDLRFTSTFTCVLIPEGWWVSFSLETAAI